MRSLPVRREPVSLTPVRVILIARVLHPPSERVRTPGGNPRGCPASACSATSSRVPGSPPGRRAQGAARDWGRARRRPRSPDVQRARLPGDGRLGAAVEQPAAAPAGAPQDLARLRGPPRRAGEVPGGPRVPARDRGRRRPPGGGPMSAPAKVDATPRPRPRAVLAVLREAYWLRMALLVVLLSIACFFLGRWPWSRDEGKVANADRVARNSDAAPADLGALLPVATQPLPADAEWRPVRLHGTYL